MISPNFSPRMKERDDGSACRVNPGEIRTLGSVATVAGQGEIARVIRPTMLLCDDMLNVMRESTLILSEQAVFAAISCTLHGHALVSRHPSRRAVQSEIALCLHLENRNEVIRVDICFVFSSLFRCEEPLICSFSEDIDPSLNNRVDIQLTDPLRRLEIETAAKRVEHPIKN